MDPIQPDNELHVEALDVTFVDMAASLSASSSMEATVSVDVSLTASPSASSSVEAAASVDASLTAHSTAHSNTSITLSRTADLSASLSSHPQMTAGIGKIIPISATASASGDATSTLLRIVPVSATATAEPSLSANLDTKFTFTNSGGGEGGGDTIITFPVYNVIPSYSTSLLPLSGGTFYQAGWIIVTGGTLPLSGGAPYQVGATYETGGTLPLSGSCGSINIGYFRGFKFYWKVNQGATASFDFSWSVGKQRKYWYRVVGQPRPDVCDPIGGDDCCKTVLATVMATSVQEVCAKLRARFGVFPVRSIQRFSKPAETVAVREDAANGITYECNQLIDQPFCNVPACASYCVDYNLSESWGFTDSVAIIPAMMVSALAIPSHTGDTLALHGSAEVIRQSLFVGQPALSFRGSTDMRRSHAEVTVPGDLSLSGAARIQTSHHDETRHEVPVECMAGNQDGEGSDWFDSNGGFLVRLEGQSSRIQWFTLNTSGIDPGDPIAVEYDRCANGLVRDDGILVRVDGVIRRDLSDREVDWAIAIPVRVRREFVHEGGKLEFGVRVRARIWRKGLYATISHPVVGSMKVDRLVLGGGAKHWRSRAEVGTSGVIGLTGDAIAITLRRGARKVAAVPIVMDEVRIQGMSKSIEPIVRMLSDAIDTTITHIEQGTVSTMGVPLDTVSGCSCVGLPLALPLSHNVVKTNKLSDFARRNGVIIPTVLKLNYNRRYDSWQGNLHYQGRSSESRRDEAWTILFDLQCASMLGGIVIGKKVWKLGMKIRQRDLLSGNHLETRALVSFLPDVVCNTGKDFRFKLVVDTSSRLARIEPTSVIYDVVLHDPIGLFKGGTWIDKPDLVLDMTQDTSPAPVRYPLALEATA